MLTPPREPNPGEPITASFMRELVRYIRAITPKSGHGTKVSTGPNGSRIDASDASGGRAGENLPSCFDISGTGSALVSFKNRYYRVGSVVYELADNTGFDLEDGKFFCALIVSQGEDEPSATVVGFASLSDMASYATSDSHSQESVIPLYQFDADGGVVCDLRNMPVAPNWEFV